MNAWISRITGYLNKFLEVGVLLLAVSIVAEILFGPNVPFFGSQAVSYTHLKLPPTAYV